MAKYKVLKTFRDKETREVYKPNTEIEMTVKRAEEVEKNLDGSFLERIDKEEKENVDTKQVEQAEKEDSKEKKVENKKKKK